MLALISLTGRIFIYDVIYIVILHPNIRIIGNKTPKCMNNFFNIL